MNKPMFLEEALAMVRKDPSLAILSTPLEEGQGMWWDYCHAFNLGGLFTVSKRGNQEARRTGEVGSGFYEIDWQRLLASRSVRVIKLYDNFTRWSW